MAVKAMGFLAVKETVTSSLRLEMPTRWPSGKWSCSGARAWLEVGVGVGVGLGLGVRVRVGLGLGYGSGVGQG